MMDHTTRRRDWGGIAISIGRFLWVAIGETFSGILHNRVPARLCYAGFGLALVFFVKADAWALEKFGFKYHLNGILRSFLVYVSLLSGWITWGVVRASQRNRLLNRLKSAFEAAGLKCNGRYPSLIEDVEIDEHVRKLRLFCNGVTKSNFEKEVEQLESVLNMTVVRFLQEESDKSRIEIVYTMKSLEKTVVLENPTAFADGEIPIGVSYERPVHVNMRDVAHILVAGQTGGGKSNFLKVATTVLTLNNRDAKVIFLDFKGGMESADIRNHARNLGGNIECVDGAKRSVERLGEFGLFLEQRLQTLASVGASNFDDYLKKRIRQKAQSGQSLRIDDERRTYIIIDEIAQLYARDPEIEKEAQERAKAAVNRIARQGRAAGVHLIVATQKPDASSFDQTVKANLPGVLCFPMANQVASISALGTKRAFELNPNIKGRAIWKFGAKTEEVQTYLFG